VLRHLPTGKCGLRDYGTASWDGGDTACGHIEPKGSTRGGANSTITGGQDLKPHEGQYRGACKKCGAVRTDAQLGMEPTPDEYVANMVAVFREVRRVLKDDGTCFLNLGDSYIGYKGANYGVNPETSNLQSESAVPTAHEIGTPQTSGLKSKDLVGIPWRVAFALQADGWWLRQDIIWAKPNPMPESVTDRCTKSHEYVFLLTKSARYKYNAGAIAEPTITQDESNRDRDNSKLNNTPGRSRMAGLMTNNYETRNRRDVWSIPTEPTSWSSKTSHLSRVDGDAASCGMMHIAVPDCPCHADLFDQVAIQFCGELEDSELIRILRKDHDRGDGQSPVASTTIENHNVRQPPDSLGSFPLDNFLSAIDRSIQTRKTGRETATSLSCMPFAEILCRTDDKLVLLASFVRSYYKDANSILPTDWDVRWLTKIPFRRLDKSSLLDFSSRFSKECVCQIYGESTKDTGHFATMPSQLVKLCMLAGSDTGDTVLDPFFGSGTVGMVAEQYGREWIGCELNEDYVKIAEKRTAQIGLSLSQDALPTNTETKP